MEKTQTRPPIVTVLGHVDHGKTSLLDAIRKTNIASREAGGITQGIGASVVTSKEGKKITFIDTPGHAAFSKMRSRGANVADLAILVVAGDDGVKPQTIEALSAIKTASIPFIVAITKIDLPSADIESVKGQLEKEGVLFEGRGGDTPAVPLSSKNGEGVNNLLDTILLVSEVHEIKGNKEGDLDAVVIETSKDKKGQLVSVVVRDGTLKVGNVISAQDLSCKIRALFNDKGQSVREIYPGEPAQILGFDKLPEVGAVIKSSSGVNTNLDQVAVPGKETKFEKGGIPIFLKAQSAGALEALVASLPQGISLVSAKVGDVNESDILDAKSSKAWIFVFESDIPNQVKALAESEGVHIEKFEIIYELLQRLDEILKKGQVETLGKAEILAIFPFNESKVAGAKVLEGQITKADKLIVVRGEKEIGKVRAISMKKQKQEIVKAGQGEEFGMIFEREVDFAVGDVILATK